MRRSRIGPRARFDARGFRAPSTPRHVESARRRRRRLRPAARKVRRRCLARSTAARWTRSWSIAVTSVKNLHNPIARLTRSSGSDDIPQTWTEAARAGGIAKACSWSWVLAPLKSNFNFSLKCITPDVKIQAYVARRCRFAQRRVTRRASVRPSHAHVARVPLATGKLRAPTDPIGRQVPFLFCIARMTCDESLRSGRSGQRAR